MQNHMRRSQMSLVFELVKLALLGFSGYLTYEFLSRFLPDMWFRMLALVLYEGGLLAWHYLHHWKAETPQQHLFSKNMERLCFLAVGSGAGFQLFSMISAGFHDSPPVWMHTGVEIVTVLVFMLQIYAFMKWSQLTRFYQAVEQGFNSELASGQRGLIRTALAQQGSVNIVEADADSGANLTLAPVAPEAAPAGEPDAELSAPVSAPGTAKKLLQAGAQKLTKTRLEDRQEALELLAEKHPTWSAAQLAQQVGLSVSTVRRWQSGK